VLAIKYKCALWIDAWMSYVQWRNSCTLLLFNNLSFSCSYWFGYFTQLYPVDLILSIFSIYLHFFCCLIDSLLIHLGDFLISLQFLISLFTVFIWRSSWILQLSIYHDAFRIYRALFDWKRYFNFGIWGLILIGFVIFSGSPRVLLIYFFRILHFVTFHVVWTSFLMCCKIARFFFIT
jgi:hypothetical protein